jgi:hypothetical protein
MNSIAKILFLFGLAAILCSGVLWLLGKIGISFGKLPGDINITGDKSSFHFPLVTCLVISIVLTIVINLVLWLLRK